jgi:hypothetical protein
VTENAYSFAILPGFPRPAVDGDHFEAELTYVKAHGLPRPILVDRTGVVWAGRTLFNVCLILGIRPEFQVIEDGHAAALHELATRDYTVLEWADFVQGITEGSGTDSVLEPFLARFPKRSKAASDWFKTVLGKTRGFSPSQIEMYLRIARCSPEQRALLADAETVNQAIDILREREQSQDETHPMTPEDPSPEEETAMKAAATFLDATKHVQAWTRSGLETLRAACRSLGSLLRQAEREVTP